MRGAARTIERSVGHDGCFTDSTTSGQLAQLFRGVAPTVGVHHAVARAERALLRRGHAHTHVGRYLVEELVGSGGSGVVYRALDPKLGRRVALKLLHPHPGAVVDQRLLAEARALASVEHENVVEVYDVGLFDDDGTRRIFLVMEWIEGSDLGRWTRRGAAPRDVLRAYLDACRGLAAVHARGILHRDFKPANVLRDRNGVVKVADFGLAEAITPAGDESIDDTSDPDGTTNAVLAGTPRYMAPEQHEGQRLDERADQYSFCVALYEGLVGEPPFDGNDLTTLADRKHRGPPPMPRIDGVPPAVAKVLARGLQPRAEDRFASTTALLEALEHAVRGEWREPVRVIGVAAVAVLGLVGALSDFTPRDDGSSSSWSERWQADMDAAHGSAAIMRAEKLAATRPDEAAARLESIFFDAVERDDARTSTGAAMALVGSSYERGRFDEALRWSEHAHAHLDSLEPLPVGRRVAWLHNTAMAHFWAGDIDRAQALLDEAADWVATAPQPTDTEAIVHGSRGTVLLFAGEPGLALPEHAVEIELRHALHGDDDPALVGTYLNEGNALYAQGREHEALEAFVAAEAIATQAGRDDVDAISATLSRVRLEARLDPRASLPEEAARAVARLADAPPAYRASAAVVAGEVMRLVDGCDDAIDPIASAIAELEQSVGVEHHVVGTSYAELAVALRECGRAPESRRALERSVEILRAVLPPDHPELGDVIAELEPEE